MLIYRSKIDVWLIVLIVPTLILSTIPALILSFNWIVLLISAIIWACFADLFYNTKYTIKGDLLTVQCGSLMKSDVDIHSIAEVSKTNTVLSAPALSLDRILITYKNRRQLVISPVRQGEFIAALQQINPDIRVRS